MPDQSNEQQRIQRPQGLLLLAWEGEGAADDMLAKKPAGTVRIRLDIGRGTGTFAARIWERNVTVVTTTMKPRGIEGVGSHPHRSAATAVVLQRDVGSSALHARAQQLAAGLGARVCATCTEF